MGINRNGLGLRILPTDGENPNTLLFDGDRAYARFLLARQLAGTTYDAMAEANLNNLDEALKKPWVYSKQQIINLLAPGNFNIQIDAASEINLEEEKKRTLATYPRWLPPDNAEKKEWYHTQGDIDENLINNNKNILTELGWHDNLFPFAFQSVAEIATKRDGLLAWAVGLGKSRGAVALSELYKQHDRVKYKQHAGPTIIVALRRHLFSWAEELPKLKPLHAAYGNDFFEWWIEQKDSPAFNKPFLLISFERLISLDKEQTEKLVKVAKNSIIILEECFPYETSVTTDIGKLPIGKIVEEELNVNILSYDVQSGKIEYKPIMGFFSKDTNTKLLQITLENGKVIECTPNHRIWIGDKYITAGELSVGQTVYVLKMQKRISRYFQTAFTFFKKKINLLLQIL